MKKIFSILFLFLGVVSFAQVKEVSDSNIKQKINVRNNKIIIIDFYATWCGPCRYMDPILKEIAQEYKGKVEIYKIDVDQNRFDNQNGVSAYPTYFFYKNGKIVKKETGAIGKKGMVNVLTSLNVSSGGSNNNYDPYNNNNGNSGNTTNGQLSDSDLNRMWNDWNALNSAAWKAYEANASGKYMNQAIKAVQRSIQLNSNYYNHDTYAALLYKKGAYIKSLKQARKAINKAKYNGDNYTSTNELILKVIGKL